MEQLTQVTIEFLKVVTFPGAVALAVLLIGKPLVPSIQKWIESKVAGSTSQLTALQGSIDLLSMNHIHELKDSLDRIERTLEKMNDVLIYLKAKSNGRE